VWIGHPPQHHVPPCPQLHRDLASLNARFDTVIDGAGSPEGQPHQLAVRGAQFLDIHCPSGTGATGLDDRATGVQHHAAVDVHQ
jgi:hypothetical protein